MHNNIISKLNDIHDLDELQAILEVHLKEAEAIKQAEARIREEQRAALRNKEHEFRSNLTAKICGLHDLNYGSCKMIVDRAWADCHSHEQQEVADAACTLAEFVEQIVHNEYQW